MPDLFTSSSITNLHGTIFNYHENIYAFLALYIMCSHILPYQIQQNVLGEYMTWMHFKPSCNQTVEAWSDPIKRSVGALTIREQNLTNKDATWQVVREREFSHSESLACVRAVTERLTDLHFGEPAAREKLQNGFGSEAYVSRADVLPLHRLALVN